MHGSLISTGLHKLGKRLIYTSAEFLLLLIGQELLMRRRIEQHMHKTATQEVQVRMNEFLSVASHELKTPLTTIKGNIQLLKRRFKHVTTMAQYPTGKDVEQFIDESCNLLERTDQQVTRLTRLVNTLLESTRIHGNTMDLLFELCDLNTLLREVLQERRTIPETRTIQSIQSETDEILVMADSSRVKHVILHYLVNAHKYSPLDQPIIINVSQKGRLAYVEVRDAGPGIPPEEHQHIWERFYRSKKVKVQNGSEIGLGLGLYVCRIVIEQHHGQVGVQSLPGNGSTFWFTLPIQETGFVEFS